MSIVKPKILSGFQDLLPAEAYQQRKLIDKLAAVFESYGFTPIQTPHLEYTECLIGETGGEIGKQLFRFEDNGGRDVCLRFDLTVPLARYVVQHKHNLTFPFKRYATGSCFRGERPQHGRFREFTQCDFDILGTESAFSDAEILQVFISGYQALGLKNFVVKLNNRKILNAFAEVISLKDKTVDFIRLLDKKDKIKPEKFQQELSDLGCKDTTQVEDFLSITDLNALKDFASENPVMSEGAQDLVVLYSTLEKLPQILEHIKLDLSLARGFGYYTGNVFEAYLPDAPEVGSIGSGGRYDNLTQNFSKDFIPGVGGSFGLSRLLVALEKLNQLDAAAGSADILISNIDSALQSEINLLASNLREKGLKVEVYPDVTKLKKQIQFADKKQIKFLIIFGSDEAAKGVWQVKNLENGQQEEFSDFEKLLGFLA